METEKKIDKDLYSRQLYVLSLEALVKLSKTNVLIVGLSGLGVEVGEFLFCSLFFYFEGFIKYFYINAFHKIIS